MSCGEEKRVVESAGGALTGFKVGSLARQKYHCTHVECWWSFDRLQSGVIRPKYHYTNVRHKKVVLWGGKSCSGPCWWSMKVVQSGVRNGQNEKKKDIASKWSRFGGEKLQSPICFL